MGLYELGYKWGQDWGGKLGLRDYAAKVNDIVTSMNGNLTRQGEVGLLSLDPITQLPFGSRQIFPAGTVAMPGVGNRATALRYVVPLGYNVVVNALQIVYTGGSFVSGGGDLLFRVMVDGRALDTLGNITTNIGTINTTEPIAPIKVQSGQTVIIEVQHVANAALGSPVNARIGGYAYPMAR